MPSDLKYIEGSDISPHLGTGGITEVETSHDDDDQEDDNDSNDGGGDDRTLMQGHGNIGERDAGKGEHSRSTLEGGRH